jgi:streptogramin lyase
VRRLQSYTSLPAGGDASGLSALARKLRLQPEHSVLVLNSPPGYLAHLDPAPKHLQVEHKPDQTFDAVQLFASNVEELRTLGPGAIHAVKPDGLLWIAYPKGGQAPGGTDLPATPWWTKRDVLGEITGEAGLKPVAFVKIDETWTALRFKR